MKSPEVIKLDSFSIMLIFIICLIGLVIYLIIRLYKAEMRSRLNENLFRDMENQVDSLQLKTLESKLNPHLFKNVLNSIQSHAYQTYYSMDKLSSVLDYILYESRNKFVTAKDEIEFAMNLIEINKIKISPLFDLRVKVKTSDIEPLYTQKLVAPLISIDLIENAFKHADLQGSDSFISIVYEFKDSKFSLTVTNKISNKTTLEKEKAGLGTDTLEKRLKIIYQENFQLEKFTEGDLYIAHLKINLLEHKAKMLAIR